jgi:hypothetical protein
MVFKNFVDSVMELGYCNQEQLAIGFREGWSDTLVNVAKLLPDNCNILEVGSYTGHSSCVLALTIQKRGGFVYTVDPGFVPEEKWPGYYAPFKADIHGDLKRVIYNGYENKCIGNIIPLPGISRDLIPLWDKRKLLDLIIIDAWHCYEGVIEDVEWCQFAKDNAYLLFDDWITGVEKAALEYLSKHKEWIKVQDRLYKKGN